MSTPRRVQEFPRDRYCEPRRLLPSARSRPRRWPTRRPSMPPTTPRSCTAMSYVASDDSSFITEIVLSPAINPQRSIALLCGPIPSKFPELRAATRTVVSAANRARRASMLIAR
jgi:hypothetical protein